MLDLEAELDAVLAALTRSGIEYAVCGGIALAIHWQPRATVDIDLLMRPESRSRAYAAFESAGFEGLTKVEAVDGDTLTLDLLLATPSFESAWQSRETVPWRGGPLSVVSREGLIALKADRASGQDLVDIERLVNDGWPDKSERAIMMRITRTSQLRKLCLSLAKAKPVKREPQKKETS